MNRTVEKGKTLLVDGPASVTVSSGKAEIFGFTAGRANKIVIREGKRLPFAVEETATFDIALAEKGSVEEVDGNTIPPSWAKAGEELSHLQVKPAVAMILGTVDSGKTSFCTYIINKLLSQTKKVVVLDGDLGQSDIGPPCTVAYAVVARPITDLFSLYARNAVFIGDTSPSGATDKVIDSLMLLKKEGFRNEPDFIIINSDGWTDGEEAVTYKARLIDRIGPDVIFHIQQKDELTPILSDLERFSKIAIESPAVVSQRSKEKRKNLRELGYIKYLRNAKVQSFQLSWLKIEGDELFGLSRTHPSIRETSRIHDLLEMKPLHISEQGDRISIIIGKRRWIDSENLKKVEETTKKKVNVIRKGEEEGLLIALYNAEREFLGIGILQEIDYLRKSLKILTPVSEDIAIVTIGRVKLDRNMKEVSAFGEEEQSDVMAFSKLF